MANRNQFLYFIAGCVIVVLGLSVRRQADWYPKFVADYAGDALWALMIFVGVGFLMPRWASFRAALVAYSFCFVIELSQLYHAPWIDGLRHTRLGGLILGYGFLWSDLLCYAAGVAVGWLVELAVLQSRKEPER